MGNLLNTRETAVVMRWHFDRFTRMQQRRFCESVSALLNTGEFTRESLAFHWGVDTSDVIGWNVAGNWSRVGLDAAFEDLVQDLEEHSAWMRGNGWMAHTELCPCHRDGGPFVICV